MLRNFYLSLLLLLAFDAYGQGTATLVGKVTDSESGKALPYASVYIDKSSLATQADAFGNYRLTNLPTGKLEVRISYIGYETVKRQVETEAATTTDLSVGMVAGIRLDDITVRAKGDQHRARLLRVISTELIGDNNFSKKCRITNPEVIVMYEDEGGHLRARSSGPIMMENQALGYRLYHELEEFDYFNGTVYFGGNTRFESLKPANDAEKQTWNRNRVAAYEGSMKHLLTSMVSNQADAEGFEIYTVRDTLARELIRFDWDKRPKIAAPAMNRVRVNPGELVSKGRVGSERVVASNRFLEVFYTKKRGRSPYSDMPYQYSEIFLPQRFMVVSEQGWIVEPRGVTVEGFLSRDRLGTLLPADWQIGD
jgi:hypothetical protein